jgi:putative membrane protein
MALVQLSLDPTVLVALGAAELLYVRAVRILTRRGQRISRWQQGSWHLGIALEAVALVGPLDPLASDLLSAHMAQHLLLADIAVPFLLAGLRNPVLMFFLPRPVLVALARRRGLRAAFRTLRRPLVAIPVYLVVLYSWHLAFAFEAALRHPVVHALQHESFALAAVLVWWPALEPQRRRMSGELWKIPYLFASRMVSMFLGVAFVFMRTPAYGAFYGERPRAHGLSPLADQQIGGGIMMSVDIVLMLGTLCLFFWRAAVDDARAEERERAQHPAAEVEARERAAAGAT